MNEECRFCAALKSSMRVNQTSREVDKLYYPDIGLWHAEFTVALVKRGWHGRLGKRSAGRTTDYRYRGLGYELNYCPECGRRLLKGETCL